MIVDYLYIVKKDNNIILQIYNKKENNYIYIRHCNDTFAYCDKDGQCDKRVPLDFIFNEYLDFQKKRDFSYIQPFERIKEEFKPIPTEIDGHLYIYF